MNNSFLVNSVGGCGSKFIVKQVIKQTNNPSFRNSHGHFLSPEKIPPHVDKVIFVFGDVFLSLQSFFNRRLKTSKLHGFSNASVDSEGKLSWAKEHCKNLDGYYKNFDEGWTLSHYLEVEKDLFRINEFYNNWLFSKETCASKFDVLFVRYEKLSDNIESILEYLNVNINTQLDEILRRTSTHENFSTRELMLLDRLYGKTNTRLSAYPDLFNTTFLQSF